MAPSVKRRHTPVGYARQLISAILSIRQQKQIPNFERISRFLQRYTDITPRRCKEHLNNAVSDGLIVEYTALGVKGQRTGLEQEGYRIPHPGEVEEVNSGHDWYCFECHGPGEVFECSDCFRVYHQGCTREDTSGEAFTCSVCMDKEASKKKNKMKKKMLNTLLSYTILRLREKTKELHKIGIKSHADDFRRYVYQKMDLNRMELKVQASRYKCLEEFYADARTILHNCTLVYGEDKGGMTELAMIMVKDCRYDLDEIELCPNCYYMSNAKPEDWFSQPCNPPHDLVFAKQKGYSYWPAKVVRDLGGKSDVRFFGGWHQRAIIPAEYIKPITTDLKSMTIKKTGGFVKAMKELKRHQQILEEREQELEANGESQMSEEDAEEEEEEEEIEEEDEEEEEDYEADRIEPMQQEEEEEEEEIVEKVEVKRSSPKKTAKRRESSSQGKKGYKRGRDELDDEEEVEDEFDNRLVTSTSVEKNSKNRKRKSFKASNDESYTVTSSVDRISNSFPVSTTSIAVQTTPVKMETVNSFSQTDPVVTPVAGEESLAPDKKTTEDLSISDKSKDDLWEERMASTMASLTKRLEERFEEDKAQALKELSERLEEDFGKDKQQAVERTIASMKQEIEKSRKAGEDKAREQYMEEMKKLAAKHKEAISQAKKKQWCQYCEEEAMYHCCWNTSYCSVKCQQEHWHKEHKRVCRRKRN